MSREFETCSHEPGELFCLWFGLPPCPACGGDHGDPGCPPATDAELREELEQESSR